MRALGRVSTSQRALSLEIGICLILTPLPDVPESMVEGSPGLASLVRALAILYSPHNTMKNILIRQYHHVISCRYCCTSNTWYLVLIVSLPSSAHVRVYSGVQATELYQVYSRLCPRSEAISLFLVHPLLNSTATCGYCLVCSWYLTIQ